MLYMHVPLLLQLSSIVRGVSPWQCNEKTWGGGGGSLHFTGMLLNR